MGLNFQIIVACILVTVAAFGLHTYQINKIEKQHIEDLATQKSSLESDCQSAKLITYGVSNEYQQNLSAIGSGLDSVLLRVRTGTVCPIPISVAASGRDAGRSESANVSKSDGVDPRRLLELAADADRERAKRRACQSYVRQLRENIGQ